MNARASFIYSVSFLAIVCCIAAIFWFSGNARVAPISDQANDYVSVESVLNGDPNYAPESVEFAIEKEFYLPHVVDIAAGSHFIPAAQTLHSENSTDLANALSGKAKQCNIRGHRSIALNDVPDCM